MAPGDYTPPTVWGAPFYDSTSPTMSWLIAPTGAVVITYRSSPALPPETPIEIFPRKSKAELARQQMRAYLARFPRQDVSMAAPARPLLCTRDPLRHHRQRQVRRTPKLSRLERALA